MAKKTIAILLMLCILLAAFPVSAQGQTPGHDDLIRQMSRCYYNTLYATDSESLNNLCGAFVGYQLYYLGITEIPEIYNGDKFYNVYSQREVTSCGYDIQLYPATRYTLEQALNTITHNGTRDAYNIMLCYDWTKPGQEYGHVMLIHGIIDGTVYAVDNFDSSISGKEGRPMVSSIDRFVREYAGWTVFEGAVEFRAPDYVNHCTEYATDMFVRATEQTDLLSEPSPVGSNDSVAIRSVVEGERLKVTALVRDENKVNYYRVKDGGGEYYIIANATQIIRLNTESFQGENVRLEKGKLAGELHSASVIGKVEFTVTNANMQVMRHTECTEPRYSHDLSKLQMNCNDLPEGVYRAKLYGTLWNYYDNKGIVDIQRQRVLIWEDTLVVGDAQVQEPEAVSTFAPAVKHSWLYEDGVWRCYRNGEPRVGWYCYDGVDYYLQEDGSVTTGWANINGQDRFFSDTGAMRTGWMKEDGGTRYLLFNGVCAKGWRQIKGIMYYFDENGILAESK